MNETAAIALFKKKFPNAKYYKLHGGKYQSSLPDILVSRAGGLNLLEFKVADNMTLPWSKFRLNQHLTMLELNKLPLANGPAVAKYIAYSNTTKKFYYFYAEDVEEGKTFDLRKANEIL